MTILRQRHRRRARHLTEVTSAPLIPARVPEVEPAATARSQARVTVAVAADSRFGLDLARLQAQLPTDWAVVSADQLPLEAGNPVHGVRSADLVVLAGTDPDAVRSLRRRSGATALIAYVPESASAGDVVAVLQAGADGCVRPCEPVLLAAHLRACHRRHAHDRHLPDPYGHHGSVDQLGAAS